MNRFKLIARHAALALACVGLTSPLALSAQSSHTANAESSQEVLNVVIMLGQSNMDGRGEVDRLPELPPGISDNLINYRNPAFQRERRQRPDVGCHSEGWVPLQPGFSLPPRTEPTSDCLSSTFGPEIGLAIELDRELPETSFGIIKFSEGGTSLRRDWDPDTRGQMYDLAIEHIEASLAELDAQGQPYRVVGIAWHQGEGDLRFTNRDGDYSALLNTFADALRSQLGQPDLPFLIGEVFDNNGGRDNLRREQTEAAQEIDHAVFVSSEGLTPIDGDNSAGGTHFDTASVIVLGRRFGSAMAQILEEES